MIPTTLAENAGLNPISIVTELRNRHANGEKTAGINVRKGLISDIREENVLQPLLVSTSAVELATETVCLLLKIDDYSPVSGNPLEDCFMPELTWLRLHFYRQDKMEVKRSLSLH